VEDPVVAVVVVNQGVVVVQVLKGVVEVDPRLGEVEGRKVVVAEDVPGP
jgi:hypothetical protein